MSAFPQVEYCSFIVWFKFIWFFLEDCKEDFSVSESSRRIKSLNRELYDPSSWVLGAMHESYLELEIFMPE